MKRKSLTYLLTILMSMVGVNAFAAFDTSTKVQVGNLYYYLDTSNHLAEVTSMPSGKYSGDIVIPASFTYNNISYSVTSIGFGAFYICSGLTSVEIPNSVTSIGEWAFCGCSSLTSVEIPNSVTSIGFDAFNSCTGMTSVTIGNSVTSIGESAFSGCSGLTSVEIPNSVTNIDRHAFGACSGLTSVEIPNSVTSIGESAFYGCTSLEKVIVQDIAAWCNISFVDGAANPLFYAHHLFSDENTEITDLVIPNSVTSIGQDAFNGCSALTSVVIPNSVTSIGVRAFYGCSGLTSVTIPNSVKNIGGAAFHSCSSLTSVTIGNGVTSIGNYTFKNCTSLTSVVIPNSVTSIGNEAFNGCTSLTSVTIGNGVTSIGENAFNNCTGLKNVTVNSQSIMGNNYSNSSSLKDVFGNQVKKYIIGYSVTSIGNYAFYECSSMTSVTIGNSVTSISYKAFGGCSGLTSVTIPNSVTNIGQAAFSNCSGLTSVTIGNGVTSYYRDSFNNCTGLKNVNVNSQSILNSNHYNTSISLKDVFGNQVEEYIIGNSVTSIGHYAFYSCSGMTSVEIPNSVTSIGKYAFRGCTGLEKVTISNSVTSIGEHAFYGCSGLEKVIVQDIAAWCNISFVDGPANPLFYAHHLYSDENTEITDLVIPNSVTSIGRSVFNGCTGLTSITIPNSVTSIGNWAFNGCSGLTSVEIPNSVTSIGDYVFDACSGLTSIKDMNKEPIPISSNTLNYLYSRATLYVPAGSKTKYQNAQYWKEFTTIKEMEKTNQTLDFITIPTLAYSGSYTLPQTTTEGLALTWSVANTNIATISGNVLTTKGAGTTTVTATQAGNDEYESFSREFTLTVNKAPLTVTAQSYTITQGDPLPTYELTYSGFVNNETSSVLTTQPTISCSATSSSAPGTYDIIVSGGSASNYTFTYVNGTLTINEGTMGITTTDNGQLMMDNVYYDLSGRRVENPAHGLYIVNGKKVFVK